MKLRASHPRSEVGTTGLRVVVALVALLIVAVVCFAVVRLASADDPAVPDDPDATNPLTERGFTDFRDRLEEVSGSTFVFRGFASANDGLVSTPADATSNQAEMFTWRDGDFLGGSTTSTETTYTSPFDLATIDAAGIPGNVELALSLANEPDRVSISFGKDETYPGAYCYEVVASNRSEEYASVRATCSGRVLENSVR